MPWATDDMTLVDQLPIRFESKEVMLSLLHANPVLGINADPQTFKSGDIGVLTISLLTKRKVVILLLGLNDSSALASLHDKITSSRPAGK